MKSQRKRLSLKSLKKLDASNSERLMQIVNKLFWDSNKSTTRKRLKDKAMNQIQRALRKHGVQPPYQA